MSPEERQLLAALFDRVRSAAATPRDPDAEAFIGQSVREVPYAPYFLSQAVIIQEQGLKAAADRIQQLEAQLRNLEQQGTAQQSQGGGFLGGLGSLFGGGQPQQPHSSVPQAGSRDQQGRLYDDYARNAPPPPQQQPVGPWNPQPSAPSATGSFLRGALGTAAGVAGGVMLADSLRSLFSPHVGGLGGFGGNSLFGGGLAGQPVEETIVNNTYNVTDDRDRDQNNDSNDQNADDQNDLASDDDNDDSFDSGGDDSSFA